MKRAFNLFDGLFILFLYFKLSETLPLSWWQVFAPYAIELLLAFFNSLDKTLGITDRVKFNFWLWAVKLKVRGAAKKAVDHINKSQNPEK